MFKKKITYVDFNGTEKTEDFYFHMSVPEATRLEAKLGGVSMEDYIAALASDNKQEDMIKFVEEIILSSYGKKSLDGKQFTKGPSVRQEFEYSQAYAELFEELMTNPESAEKFAQGVSVQTKALNKPVKAQPAPIEVIQGN